MQDFAYLLESKIILSNLDLCYLELICWNLIHINNLDKDNEQIRNIIITKIKNNCINLASFLFEFIENNHQKLMVDNNDITFNKSIVNSLFYIINNKYEINAEIKKMVKNISNTFIKINDCNKTKNENDKVNNLSFCLVYLIIVLQSLNGKSYLKYLYRKNAYNLNNIKSNENEYKIIYQKQKDIISLDKFFMYYANIKDEDNIIITEIILINNIKEEIKN